MHFFRAKLSGIHWALIDHVVIQAEIKNENASGTIWQSIKWFIISPKKRVENGKKYWEIPFLTYFLFSLFSVLLWQLFFAGWHAAMDLLEMSTCMCVHVSVTTHDLKNLSFRFYLLSRLFYFLECWSDWMDWKLTELCC